ncbi:MAG: methyltransferase domain-containing protein [Thiotrichales bacterium]|nr:MAG: methyltransferase domain-containing protein [Thiotrichales bacterium]
MKSSDIHIIAALGRDDSPRDRQNSISRSARISVLASLDWRSDDVTHIDNQFLDNLNVWRDYFPPELEAQLDGRGVNDSIRHQYSAGEALPGFTASQVHVVKQQQFNRNFSRQVRLEPRLGRFYPRGIFENIPGNYRSNQLPCRIIALDDATITADFNHPLAARTLDVELRVMDIWAGGQEHGGRCNDIIEILTGNGPGMQARHGRIATDFWSDDPFARSDTSADEAFYSTPRLVHHLDSNCALQIGELYRQLLPHDGRILDLMSSWVSHLPAEFTAANITGLGMNREELEQNPLLSDSLVHNLNLNPALPFADESFDGIICTASIEYLISPMAVFSELARILKAGAPLVISFSNRWFPPKAIQAWGNAHEFERIGLVLEYFIENGAFDQLHSYSLRGLPRPPDDKYAGELLLSDPVYAVWGYKRK